MTRSNRIRAALGAGLLALSGLLGPLAAQPAAAAERIALVIGNRAYQHAPEAVSARRDAESVAAALRDSGYEVILGLDLDRRDMRGALERFTTGLEDARKAVVFYSGHAIRSGGRSYLAPVDARNPSLASVLLETVPLELVLRLAALAEEGAVVFVDAAQLAGFVPRDFAEPGLAEIAAPEGVLVVSAAPPGRAIRRADGRDSRFARLVIDRFLEPDAPAGEVAGTVGGTLWQTGAAAPDFAIVEAPGVGAGAELAREIELAFWQAAERSGAAEDYEAYLARYPEGEFVAIARNRLRQIERDARAPEELAEEALGLDRKTRRQLQRALGALGHDPRGVDGIFGPASRAAIRDWQRASGYPATGYLAAPQPQAILAAAARREEEARRAEEARRHAAEEAERRYWEQTGASGTIPALRAYLERYPEGIFAEQAEARLDEMIRDSVDRGREQDRRFWEQMAKRNTAEAYRAYLARFPRGLYAAKAERRLARIEERERDVAEQRRFEKIEAKLGLNRDDRRSVEIRLGRLGYEPGNPDGVFDQRSRAAIAEFQRDHNLPSTGYLDRRNLVLLVQITRNQRAQEITPGQVIDQLMRQIQRDRAK
ncbi:peptidoglycan-binding domain-containing protein [Paralimibaculum aggregatum]|uniref:Peptidoglycan-binding domain-containing protein n=1 Tax=Paralimibaculum aggregatum TaxID=3036245 RepID=A0ABQ6LQ08_9RHOB|nr:peptidoglycan-binding protein [Limibaculum sp. NKW23]GMG82859.1 peptidoglycan-binding domain-containing protein [Limibaculum sp. NKW23]